LLVSLSSQVPSPSRKPREGSLDGGRFKQTALDGQSIRARRARQRPRLP
jgi:hypothetical protein